MTLTRYTIEPIRSTFQVMAEGKLFIYGFNSIESALHGIWVKEGAVLGEWFAHREEDGAVLRGGATTV